jgi:hypothetical protein
MFLVLTAFELIAIVVCDGKEIVSIENLNEIVSNGFVIALIAKT